MAVDGPRTFTSPGVPTNSTEPGIATYVNHRAVIDRCLG